MDEPLTNYDQALEREGTVSVQRTQPRSSWWILAALMVIFGVLCMTTGIRCAHSDGCVVVDEVRPCGQNTTCTVYQVHWTGDGAVHMVIPPGAGPVSWHAAEQQRDLRVGRVRT